MYIFIFDFLTDKYMYIFIFLLFHLLFIYIFIYDCVIFVSLFIYLKFCFLLLLIALQMSPITVLPSSHHLPTPPGLHYPILPMFMGYAYHLPFKHADEGLSDAPIFAERFEGQKTVISLQGVQTMYL